MTVEVRPPNDKCNLSCTYCYQNGTRDANTNTAYSLSAMLQALERHNTEFSLFGGEPLLTKPADLERLLAYGFAKYGRTSLQTNGTLIGRRELQLFKQYNTYVGISIDGPGALNDARFSHSISNTRKATAKTTNAIRTLSRENIPFSIIVTLSKKNCKDLFALKAWFRWLDRKGCRGIRLHTLEVDNTLARRIALDEEEQKAVFHDLMTFESQLSKSCKFDRFDEMRRMLMGNRNNVTCEWNFCDPLSTPAVQGIESDGTSSNCGRTYKDGIKFVKVNQVSRERQLALYHTPYEHGGCSGCRFFMFCGGECPGTAINGDWRNRTEHCGMIFSLYERVEKELLAKKKLPLSLAPDRRDKEKEILRRFGQPDNHFDSGYLNTHSDNPHSDSHLDTKKVVKLEVRK